MQFPGKLKNQIWKKTKNPILGLILAQIWSQKYFSVGLYLHYMLNILAHLAEIWVLTFFLAGFTSIST